MKACIWWLAPCLLSLASVDSPRGQAETPSNAADVALTSRPPTPPPAAAIHAKLPFGTEEILKLSQAKVGDELVLNYIRNSGTIYNLSPEHIIHLRNQGVSDGVINTMINQRTAVPALAEQSKLKVDTTTPQAVSYTSPSVVQTPAHAPEPAPSTLHIIPHPQTRAAFYGPPPHYYRPPDLYRMQQRYLVPGRRFYSGATLLPCP